MDGVGVGMAAVALVLLGVGAVASQGENEAPLPYRSTRNLRLFGLVLLAIGAATLIFAAVLLVGGELGGSIAYFVLGGLQIYSRRSLRRSDTRLLSSTTAGKRAGGG